jgi:DNA gyrase subunit A
MGRNAAGNRGISLKKGDYVIGAAITDSDAMRDKERDECAAKLGLSTPSSGALRKA